MSSPLPLRLCCMAAMAPALTEAATQARIRLISSPTTASPTNTTVINGREGLQSGHDINDCRSNRPQGSGGRVGERLNGKQSYITLTTPSHLQNGGGLTLKTQLAQFGSKSGVNLANLGVIPNLPSFHKQERLLTFVKQNGDCHQSEKLATMNHQITAVTTSTSTILVNSTVLVNTNLNTNTTGGGTALNTQQLPAPSQSKSLGIGSLNAVSGKNNDRILRDKNVENHKTTSEHSLNTRLNREKDETLVVSTKSQSTPIQKTAPPVSNKTSLTNDPGKGQLQLERRAEYLLRRLRRLQTKHTETHISQQMSGFVDYQHANLQVMVNSGKRQTSVQATDLKTELLHSEDVKNLSTSALVSLVRKLQSSQGVSLRQRLPNLTKHEPSSVLSLDKEFCQESDGKSGQLSSLVKQVESGIDSDATDSSSGGESCDEYDRLPERDKKSKHAPLQRQAPWKWAVDRAGVASRWTWLQAQVSDLEYRIRQQSEIYRQIRANKGTVILGEAPSPEDLMAKFRASRTGRRLSPIEAKIASIEKKNEMSSPCNISTLLSNVDKQSTRLTQSFPCLSPSPLNSPLSVNGKPKTSTPPRSMNGYVDTNRNSASEGSDVDSPDSSVIRTQEQFGQTESFDFSVSPVVDNSCQAARCRPVKSYRKRKLLRTAGLQQVSRKAARLSSVKCQCYPPVTPCAMCGGRYNNNLKVDPDVMPLTERISLLDSSTHPILSFPQDVPLSIHFEALLKSGEWQNKPLPKSKLSADRRKNKIGPQGKDHGRATKRYARNSVLLSTAKYRKKLEKASRPRNRSASLPTTPRQSMTDGRKSRTAVKRRRAAKLAIAAMKRSRRSLSGSMSISVSSHGSSGSGSRTPTPSPQTREGLSLSASSLSATLREMKDAALKKKRVESDYDINNIVIPYSMAASTRVTRLKYKEIMTPKWRDITEPEDEEQEPEEQHQPTETGDGPPSNTEKSPEAEEAELDDDEDISDDAFTERHQKCESQEKKRFMTFVQYGRRVRGSRTESGANTPDPISPEFSPESEFLPPNGGVVVGGGNGSVLPTVISTEAWSSGVTGLSPVMTSSTTFATIASREGRESKDNGFFRKRSGSMTRRERSVSGEDSASISSLFEMEWVVADPWPLRNFPLEEEEYQVILAEQPSVEELHQKAVEETAKKLMAAPPISSVLSLSRSSSPAPSSTTSLSEEDPNDPEWTVIADRSITLPKGTSGDIFMKITKN